MGRRTVILGTNSTSAVLASAWVAMWNLMTSIGALAILVPLTGVTLQVAGVWILGPIGVLGVGLPMFGLCIFTAGVLHALRQRARGQVYAALTTGCRKHVPCKLGLPAFARLGLIPGSAGDMVLQDFRAIPQHHGAGLAVATAALKSADEAQLELTLTCTADMAPGYAVYGFLEEGVTTSWVFPLQRRSVLRMRRKPLPQAPATDHVT